jgi:hypothetical protein
LVRADNNPLWGRIIAGLCGNQPEYKKDQWKFKSDTPDTVIPKIIAALVEQGCLIKEVKQEKNDLKQKIKEVYGE